MTQAKKKPRTGGGTGLSLKEHSNPKLLSAAAEPRHGNIFTSGVAGMTQERPADTRLFLLGLAQHLPRHRVHNMHKPACKTVNCPIALALRHVLGKPALNVPASGGAAKKKGRHPYPMPLHAEMRFDLPQSRGSHGRGCGPMVTGGNVSALRTKRGGNVSALRTICPHQICRGEPSDA